MSVLRAGEQPPSLRGKGIAEPSYSPAITPPRFVAERCRRQPADGRSTIEQNTERQLDGIKLDGKDTKRPRLVVALEYVREGDTLIVHSLDRLAQRRGPPPNRPGTQRPWR